jgi:2-methylcitrate dehydratase
MDATTGRIANYAATLICADLPADVVHECKRRIVDTVGCALGAFDEPPSRIARALAERASVSRGARVLGTGWRALPELAAFANGVMARYLDGNDVFPGGGGHPSDVLSAVLAAADLADADGPAVITGIVLGYEIYGALFRAACMRDHGLDHVFYTAVGSAVGAAKVLGLDRDRIAQAVALAVTPNIALHATRRGELSMWKGAAAGNAARNGVFAALLAAAGMTGPDKPIDGSDGVRELLGTFELGEFGGNGRPFQLPRADFKYFLSEFHSQSPITAAIELRRQIAAEEIESVTVHTYWFAWSEIGSGAEKWHPTTRESADHSLPYILAAVLIDGRFSDDIFSENRIRDARIHEMARRIAVNEDKAYSRQFPAKIPCRIEIRTKSGKELTAQVDYPRGHTGNPMTDEEVWAKFRMLAGRKLPKGQVEQALETMWAFDRAKGLDPLFESVRIGR